MKLTGHKTEAVYRRYAITSAADFRRRFQVRLVTFRLRGVTKRISNFDGHNTGTIRRLSEA